MTNFNEADVFVLLSSGLSIVEQPNLSPYISLEMDILNGPNLYNSRLYSTCNKFVSGGVLHITAKCSKQLLDSTL